jgi:hypothetical protein
MRTRRARLIDRIPEGGRRPPDAPRRGPKRDFAVLPKNPTKSTVLRGGGYSDSSESLSVACGPPQPAKTDPSRPRCRYCGEPSIHPWGGQQVCARCEAIRSHVEQAAFGGILEMVTHAQRRLGDDELYRAVSSALASRKQRVIRAERDRRRAASPWGVGAVVVTRRSGALRARAP